MRRRAPHAGATLPAARWLGPLLTAAVLLAAAPDPASAQSYSGSPKLYRSSLNGATITLTGIYFGDGVAGQVSQYGILDWPGSGSGSLSIQSVSTNQGAGTVTLTLAYTGTFVTDQSIRITLNELVTSAGDHLTLGSIPVFVSDPGLAVGAVARPVAEYGTTATFTVKLQTQPSAAVTVAVTSQDTSEGRVSPASLLFSTSTWNTARTVTVTGVDDTLTDNDQTWNVRLDPSSSDTAYNGLSNVDVAVTTLDDEGAPVVNSVTITSTPATRGTYVLGETIAVRVGFDRSVTVTGTPQLALTVGTATRQAAYAAGSGSAMLTFRYPVQAGDADGNGIAIGAAALTLNGGQIRRTGGTVSARLGLGASALTDAAGHEVDAVPRAAGGARGGDKLARRGNGLRAGRDDCGHRDVQQTGSRDRDPAAGADDRDGHPAGGLRRRGQHGHGPDLPIHGGAGGRRRGRAQHRGRRAHAQRRHDPPGRQPDGERGAGAGVPGHRQQRGPPGDGRHGHHAGSYRHTSYKHSGVLL